MNISFTGENVYVNEDGKGNCYRCQEYKYLDPHHRVRRANDKPGKYVVKLCRECHNWVHQHPALSREQGYEIEVYDTVEYKEKYGKTNKR